MIGKWHVLLKMALKIQREGITGLMVTYPSSPLSIFVDYGETQI